MKIQIACAESVFPCHAPCRVVFHLACDMPLGTGDRVDVQFPQTWTLISGPSHTRPLQTESPAGAHYVAVESPGAPGSSWQVVVTPRTEHFPVGHHRHGRLITATLKAGAVPAGVPVTVRYENTVSPFVAESESVWIRVNGEAPTAPLVLRTTPGPEVALRLLAPSAARPGVPFEALVVSLDRFENASNQTFRDEVLTLADGRVVARNLHGTGALRVPVVLREPGVHRLRFRNVVSNAIRVAADAAGPYWGDIHIHTKLSHDAQGTDPYRYARDVSGLDFAGVADHVQSLGEAGYRQVAAWAEEAHRPGRFVTILADERNPRSLTGHHNIYFRDLEAFMAHRHPGPEAPRLPVDQGQLDPGRTMVIPHHTGIQFGGLPKAGQRGGAVDWSAWDDADGLRRVMEIYSHHGQSESYAPHHILAYEFNRMRNPERRGNTSVPGPYYAQDYWQRGVRVGVIGSSDEHSGQGGRRHGGLAAVWASELTREAVFDAMGARACYATTGERILMTFHVEDTAMGGVRTARRGARLRLRLAVWGTDLLVRTEILRFRFGVDGRFQPILAELPHPDQQGFDAAFEVEDAFEGPCMYYARVVQEPLVWPAMAWSSPVWVDAEADGKNG